MEGLADDLGMTIEFLEQYGRTDLAEFVKRLAADRHFASSRLEAAERLAEAVRSARQLARAIELVAAVRARDQALADYESLGTPDATADDKIK